MTKDHGRCPLCQAPMTKPLGRTVGCVGCAWGHLATAAPETRPGFVQGVRVAV